MSAQPPFSPLTFAAFPRCRSLVCFAFRFLTMFELLRPQDAGTGALTPAGQTVPDPTGPTQDPRFGTAWEDGSSMNRFGSRPERGPRHLCFHPALPVLYTADEQSNTVTPYSIDLAGGGGLTPKASEETLPAECTLSTNVSEIRISADGAVLWCPNRALLRAIRSRASLLLFAPTLPSSASACFGRCLRDNRRGRHGGVFQDRPNRRLGTSRACSSRPYPAGDYWRAPQPYPATMLDPHH